MQPVAARISHPGVHPGDPDPGLAPVAAARGLAGQVPLGLAEPAPARRRNLGLAAFRPSDRTAKCVSPRSIPVSTPDSGSGSPAAWTTKLAKYRPAASLITVTLDGSEGRSRDQRTAISPIFGSRSFPPGVTAKRALAVNRIACRRSLRDRNRGGPALGPFRVPAAEAKKFRYAAARSASACCSTTADTSPSQARSRVALAAVSRADSSPPVRYGCPAACASCRAASASLNTTRAQPNARASACRWPGAG